MSDPYVGEIRWFPYTFAPRDWAECDGRLLPIAGNETLYSLLGTTYGGNGQDTFGLPDFRGRVPIHRGQGPGLSQYVIGQTAGTETVTLNVQQMPAHGHLLQASTAVATATTANGNVPAQLSATQAMYVSDTTGLTAATPRAGQLGVAGGSQPHENCGPTLTLRPCIALVGFYPSRN